MALQTRRAIQISLVILFVVQIRVFYWAYNKRETNASAQSRRPTPTVECKDKKEECELWKKQGECEKNTEYMIENCKLMCGMCATGKVGRDIAGSEFVSLNSQEEGDIMMPNIGFGTAALGADTSEVVSKALKLGYRHIDTAMAREWYREDLVGKAIQSSGIDRSSLFITSKIHPRDLGEIPTRVAITTSLSNVRTTYLDLMLLHYSKCFGNLCKEEPAGTWKDSWRVLEESVDKGHLRSIGVSNFGISELKQLLEFSRIPPAVVQSHSDPLQPNNALQDFCAAHNIQFVAYSSLGTQHAMRSHGVNPILTNNNIIKIAQKHGTSPGVIVLRWALHHGQVVIPRTKNEKHMAENLKSREINLTTEEYTLIDTLK